MLISLDDTGKRVMASDATKEASYFCPECHEPMTLKQGKKVIHHFAHKSNNNCDAGETIRHMQMKMLCKTLFPKGEIEVRIGCRIADFVIGSAVIECQHSPISLEEIEERNADYQEYGYTVLWVWDLERVCKVSDFSKLKTWTEYRISQTILDSCQGSILVSDTKEIKYVVLGKPDYREGREINGVRIDGYYPKTKRKLIVESWTLRLPNQ